ncbi:hypothetical protein EJ03DRAFT_80290 [Teratosphaeria nubilosa]|uniref:Uncharacterized protein n=1 Tax=Teratosphaeria nubilosa TaxID=161662 RepID=A0A6G1LC20_9PEZI|nr:hypothetical protein EJ03DRAFT_80290 [Teratosphaeria nubilosa]
MAAMSSALWTPAHQSYLLAHHVPDDLHGPVIKSVYRVSELYRASLTLIQPFEATPLPNVPSPSSPWYLFLVLGQSTDRLLMAVPASCAWDGCWCLLSHYGISARQQALAAQWP